MIVSLNLLSPDHEMPEPDNVQKDVESSHEPEMYTCNGSGSKKTCKHQSKRDRLERERELLTRQQESPNQQEEAQDSGAEGEDTDTEEKPWRQPGLYVRPTGDGDCNTACEECTEYIWWTGRVTHHTWMCKTARQPGILLLHLQYCCTCLLLGLICVKGSLSDRTLLMLVEPGFRWVQERKQTVHLIFGMWRSKNVKYPMDPCTTVFFFLTVIYCYRANLLRNPQCDRILSRSL